MVTPRNEWMPFHEFFALAQQSGVDEVDAAEALLEEVKASGAGLTVAGIFRKWDPPSQLEDREWFRAETAAEELRRDLQALLEQSAEREQKVRRFRELCTVLDAKYRWKERLPRELGLKVVPISAWLEIYAVEADLSSSWTDDAEKPQGFIEVDWISGGVKLQRWELRNTGGGRAKLDYVREEYTGLHVERAKAKELLKRLSGAPERRGAPSRPRNPEDLPIIEEVLEAIRGGDTRSRSRIVLEKMPPQATPEMQENMKRRILRWVK